MYNCTLPYTSTSDQFRYAVNYGIYSSADYNKNHTSITCNKTEGPYKFTNYSSQTGCDNLANAITGRPVAVVVDATNWSTYKSGIFKNCNTSLNHAVLLVGITDAYWLVQNSWGTTWGESGFIRLARGNTCGVCQSASYPAA